MGLTSEGQTNTAAIKKPLQSKKSVLGAANAGVQRRRAALGDVSNVTKGDGVEVNELKEVKKTATARVGLTSKAVPHAGGVQKITRTNTTRAALGVRDTNKREPELKRPGSGSGVMGPSQLKRQPSPKSLVTDENYSGTEEPPRKRIDSGKKATAFKEYSEVEVKSEAEVKREVEVQREIEVKTEVQVKREVEVKEEIYSDVQDGEQVINLDEDDELDPLMVPDYAVEIFDYLLEIEPQTMPNPNYIEHQDELEWKMRGILVDWLIEVHTRFRMLPETLFLSVNIIDRFLSNDVVALDRLQLVGVAAMFIAAKYEEILSPHVATFSHVADETFTDKEILDAERHILATLDYDISYPNPMNFLRRISKADNYDVQARTYGKYLMEISLLDHRFMCYRQSLIAAAAMYFARLILDHGPWVR